MVIRGWSGSRHVTKRLGHALSVMCATYLYQLELPSGLTMHIVSRLSQQIKVIRSDLLLINGIDLVKIETFRMAQIWVDLIPLDPPPANPLVGPLLLSAVAIS
jgi:hypothetical protein